jgi:hypothetical protein
MRIALIALAAAAFTGTASQAATIVQNGSFEVAPAPGTKGKNNRLFSTLATTSPGWDIFTSLPGWTSIGGAGIEIQADAAVGHVDALFGKHYVELDSNNNSAMRQSLTLGVGRYLLSFWYSPRALQGGTTSETNGIGYSVADLVGSITGPGGASGTAVGKWTEVTGEFFVKTAGTYNLDFRAEGTSDSYGGFIDNVSVAPVPVPAAGLLLVGALGGLAALRRRRASA